MMGMLRSPVGRRDHFDGTVPVFGLLPDESAPFAVVEVDVGHLTARIEQVCGEALTAGADDRGYHLLDPRADDGLKAGSVARFSTSSATASLIVSLVARAATNTGRALEMIVNGPAFVIFHPPIAPTECHSDAS
jgi:hypothetical protein